MMINDVSLKYYSKAPHLSMVIAGFVMLWRQGIIKNLSVKDATSESIQSTGNSIVEAVIDGKIKIAYDVCDGYTNVSELNESYASSVDYYFMRSFSDEYNKKLFPNTNVYPLGMNYYCTVKHSPFDKAVSIKEKGRNLLKPILSRFNPQIGVVFDVKRYEQIPSYDGSKEPRILFNTRLWNPQGDVGEKKWERLHPERVQINETRIEVIKKAAEKYGSNFSGGLYDTAYAREKAPEIILNNSLTNKRDYLRNMRTYDICIGSAGLHGSIGWKTAEYVASSKAIVMERPIYTVPGGFEENKNYLGFSSVDECLEKLDYLCKNKEAVAAMQKCNYEYYNEWLRPDRQIYHSLETALENKC